MAVTDPRPGEALATGDAVNAAARIEQAAEPGQVLVSERTAQAARHFRFGPPQVLEVRGQGGAADAPSSSLADQPITEGTLSGTRAPLVGRRRELELLDHDLPAAWSRRSARTSSRSTARPASARAASSPSCWQASRPRSRRRGSCAAAVSPTATASATGRWPRCSRSTRSRSTPIPAESRAHSVSDAAEARWPRRRRRRAGGARGHARREHRPRARRSLAAQRAGGARRDAPRLALVLLGAGVGRADHRARRGRAVGRRRRARAARGRRGSRRGPALRAVHGAARADDQAADLGRRAAELHRARRRAARCGRERAARASCCSRPAAARASTRRSSRGRRATRSSSRRSCARAPTARPSADGLPDTVHSALAARIDLLPADEKRALQAAAVVGRVFWPGAVAEVAALDADAVGELLDRLQNRDLILGRLSSSMSGQRELIFKHALICEVAYESLPRRDRARMHRDRRRLDRARSSRGAATRSSS